MKLDNFVPLEIEVVEAMLDLAELKSGEIHIELGAGDGRFVFEAIKRGANSWGWEIDEELVRDCQKRNVPVMLGDCFDADVSNADVVSFWFTKPGTDKLMDKLYREMKPGARLVMLYDSLSTTGGLLEHEWKPAKTQNVIGNIICLYVR